MAIINKAALKAQFKTGGVPAIQSMFNLVDSVLVKRDDVFYGKWTPGITYNQGDVVIYGKAFYYCITGEGVNPCAPESAPEHPDPLPASFCSQEPPPLDKVNWQLMFEVPDEDWAIIRGTDGNPDVLYAKVFGNIGMGTSAPEARVHIHDGKKGADFLFNPLLNGTPAFVIKSAGEGSLTESVEGGKAVFTTDTQGFLFQKSPALVPETAEGETSPPPLSAAGPVLIHIADEKTAVSVGHLLPEAVLDIQGSHGSRVLLAPLAHKIPEVVCWNKSEAGSPFLAVGVDANSALLTTNAPDGMYVRTSHQDVKTYITESGEGHTKTIVSIKNDKKIGIGTETPKGELDILSKEGRLLLNLSPNDNPVMRLINIRSVGNNYLALGANNNQAVFMTDSIDGFAFKKANNEPTDITGDDNLMIIKADKKVGIGTTPENYELDLYGSARMFSLYLNTDLNKIRDQKPLYESLEKLKLLKPVTFKWKENATPPLDKGVTEEQIGFLPANVQKHFPELVKNDNHGCTIAYANMVAVLTKAIQELEQRVCHLEKSLKK